jgi:hypothetical protein
MRKLASVPLGGKASFQRLEAILSGQMLKKGWSECVYNHCINVRLWSDNCMHEVTQIAEFTHESCSCPCHIEYKLPLQEAFVKL